jgi:hypothetical protein
VGVAQLIQRYEVFLIIQLLPLTKLKGNANDTCPSYSDANGLPFVTSISFIGPIAQLVPLPILQTRHKDWICVDAQACSTIQLVCPCGSRLDMIPTDNVRGTVDALSRA